MVVVGIGKFVEFCLLGKFVLSVVKYSFNLCYRKNLNFN